jgi:hypothetical protein
MMILALALGNYPKTDTILWSLVFAVVMILNDWQDTKTVRKDDAWPWWLRLGLVLLASFSVGALVNKSWSGFVIGLVGFFVDVRLLMHRIAATTSASPKS